MAGNDLLKRLLDAGMQFTDMTTSRAEDLVKSFVKQGDLRKRDAEQMISTLVDRGREGTEKLLALVQQEVARQVGLVADQVDGLESRFEELTVRLGMRNPAAEEPIHAPAPAKK